MIAMTLVASPLKVMSYNIRYGTADDGLDRWEVRRPRTLKLINQENPDLLGVQEALDFQLREIAESRGYQIVGVGRDDGVKAGEHSAILFNPKRLQLLASDTFWLSDTPQIPASKSWGNRITRICTWAHFLDRTTGKDFYHYNAHLDHESQPSREKSGQLILGMIERRLPKAPVIVSGDFNVGEANGVVQVITAGGFRDSYRMIHPEEKDVVTFNGWNPKPTGDKIDYLFVDSNWKVTSAEIVRTKIDGRWPSDHMPVTMTVER